MKKDIYYSDFAKELDGEYKKAYDQIVFYIDVMNPANGSLPEIMNDVIDLLLSAQKDGRDITQVIGNDRLHFCQEIVHSHQKHFLHNVLEFVRGYRVIAGISFLLELFSLFVDYMDGIPNPLQINVEIGGVVWIILITLIAFEIFSKLRKYLVCHTTWYNRKLDQGILILLFIGVLLMAFTLPSSFDHLIRLPKWLFLLITISVYIICTWIKKQEKHRDIENDNYISMNQLAYNANLEQLQKCYRKYEKKRIARQLPVEDVKNWYEKHYQNDQRNEMFGKILSAIVFLVFCIPTFLGSTFIDACIFAVIMITFYFFFYRFLDKGTKAKKAIYQDIKAKNTDIFDDQLKQDDLPF